MSQRHNDMERRGGGQYRSEISGCGHGILSRTFDDYQLFTTLRPCDLNGKRARPYVRTRIRTYADFGDRMGGGADVLGGVLIFTRYNRTVYRHALRHLPLISYGPSDERRVGRVRPKTSHILPCAFHIRLCTSHIRPCASHIRPCASHIRPFSDFERPSEGRQRETKAYPESTKTSRCRLDRGPDRNPTPLHLLVRRLFTTTHNTTSGAHPKHTVHSGP